MNQLNAVVSSACVVADRATGISTQAAKVGLLVGVIIGLYEVINSTPQTDPAAKKTA